ncbi:MAG: DUF1592 domain-containing protein [Planctomycetaceae bacterium]
MLLQFATVQLMGQDSLSETPAVELELKQQFDEKIAPLLKTYCVQCHNEEEMESGIRVDHLLGDLPENRVRLWMGIRKQIASQAMPPEGEAQLSEAEQKDLLDWIDRGLIAVRSREVARNGSVRRLTVAQFRNSLRELLGIEDDFTEILPPDAVSKDGFLNNADSMLLSPVLLEAYFEIAEKTLDAAIVDESTPPAIQNFRMDLGKSINPEPCPDNLILGANSHLLANEDFIVTQLTATKPFPSEPFFMRTEYRFIEGYQGNDTVRGWREYDSIYHSVFACMRGAEGYPKGVAYQTVPEGLLLRPAIPTNEIFQVDSTYGPKANFKISLRELPESGNFKVRVKAAKYDDGLLLERRVPEQPVEAAGNLVVTGPEAEQAVMVPNAGIYQVDVHPSPGENKTRKRLDLKLGNRHFSGELVQPAFLLVQLPVGELQVKANLAEGIPLDRIQLTPLAENDALVEEFNKFANRSPLLGVQLGLRRDCGSTLAQVGEIIPVSSTELQEFQFTGAIRNYPSPEVEKDNVNYLAGIKEIGVHSEYTDGRDRPRMLVHSIEFEGPYYEEWPPASHQSIFFPSANKEQPEVYAREIITSFATRAFRRPVTSGEVEAIYQVWQEAFSVTGDFQQSIKESLLVVFTSPQFLFLIENSTTPEPEPLDNYELVSKLSYFLWNSPPDEELLDLASTGNLEQNLDGQVTRMIQDSRFELFLHEFTTQWLTLDKLDVVETNRELYPRLNRHVKYHLHDEPEHFLKYLIQENLPVENLTRSDFIVANEVVAGYYSNLVISSRVGLNMLRLSHGQQHLGGVLTQAGILAGLSDGKEANSVKRGG